VRIAIELNVPLAQQLSERLKTLADACAIDNRVTLQLLSTFPGIIEVNSDIDDEALWNAIFPVLQETWQEFDMARVREGHATQENILLQLANLEQKLIEIRLQAGLLEQMVQDQIKTRFRELLEENYDERRVLQEVAVQLVRLTINEEVERLAAHFAAFRTMVEQPACGKKLDFLCQEMNREINTIGSKSMLVPISHAVVSMKEALENIREQLRNVE